MYSKKGLMCLAVKVQKREPGIWMNDKKVWRVRQQKHRNV